MSVRLLSQRLLCDDTLDTEVLAMTNRFAGGLAALVLFLACAGGARAADNDACWQVLYRALEQSAAAPHVPYIRYYEAINLTEDGQYYEQARANVVYRDDGMAYVDDNRWAHPYVSRVLEPGPPLLGPYGSHRDSWLSLMQAPNGPLPLIADTHNPPTGRCIDRGDETIDGATVAHLILPDGGRTHPGLKEIWLDRHDWTIRRAVVSQYLTFLVDYEGTKREKLVDYTIHVQQVDGYNVLRQLNWEYTYRTYEQYSTIRAEYRFSNFEFDTKPPLDSMFAVLH